MKKNTYIILSPLKASLEEKSHPPLNLTQNYLYPKGVKSEQKDKTQVRKFLNYYLTRKHCI